MIILITSIVWLDTLDLKKPLGCLKKLGSVALMARLDVNGPFRILPEYPSDFQELQDY